MASYRIWCRTNEVGDGQFLVTVVALPEPPRPDTRVESESRLLRSRSDASVANASMVVALGERLAARGDEVTQIFAV